MKKLIDWSLLTEQQKYDWVDNCSPDDIVQFIDGMKKQKQTLYDRIDKANAEIKLLKEQIHKFPYIFSGGKNERKKDN